MARSKVSRAEVRRRQKAAVLQVWLPDARQPGWGLARNAHPQAAQPVVPAALGGGTQQSVVRPAFQGTLVLPTSKSHWPRGEALNDQSKCM